MKHSHTYSRAVRLALLLAAAMQSARADQLCHTVAVPLTSGNYDVEVPIPRFDTAFGTLLLVTVSIEVTVIATAQVENLSTMTESFALTRGATSTALAIDGVPFVSVTQDVTTMHTLSAYDGLMDFGGTSGFTLPPLTLTSGLSVGSRGDAGALALYAGPPGNPGPSGTRARAIGLSVANGAGNLLTHFGTDTAFTRVSVCYDYTPRIASTCAGDGTAAACPCGNSGGPGEGCANSLGFGSLLSATGGAAISADTLVLNARVPNTTTTLFLQSTQIQAAGQGIPFGDGLRCASGTVVRLGSGPATVGNARYPGVGDPPVSVRGLVPPGATRYYQAWYRSPPTFCTPSSFNLSNALRVEWGN